MSVHTVTKEQIVHTLDQLPPENLQEVQQFIDFLRFKSQKQAQKSGAALGGLLDGYRFTEEDIAQARREMWGRVDQSAQ